MNVEPTATGRLISQRPVREDPLGRSADDDFAAVLGCEMPNAASEQARGKDGPGPRQTGLADQVSDRPDAGRGDQGTAGRTAEQSASNDGAGPDSTGDGLQNPDSGQEQDAASVKGVDGSENGFRPGASTEAPVNALALHPTETHQGADATPAEAVNRNARLPGAVELNGPPDSMHEPQVELNRVDGARARQEEAKLTAAVISNRSAQANLSAAGEGIVVFETGLAEQMLRAVVETFKDTRSSTRSGNSPSGDHPAGLVQGLTEHVGGEKIDRPVFARQFESILARTDRADGEKQGNIGRIAAVIRNNIGRRHSQLTVRLEPPELGRLRIDVRLIDNHLRLTIGTETTQARDVITQRFEVLRTALESQGVTVSRFDVQTREFSSFQNDPQQQWGDQAGHHGRQFGTGDQGSHPDARDGHGSGTGFHGQQSPPQPTTVAVWSDEMERTKLNLVA